ncbi:pseudouridine synthase [Solitalea sp. MAHUQ-68]|uniref:Pseudouridine synthase n=1 Tax=Solitalea agri TaxID=2953739 RepID=A0A9X2F7S2_9SPHI|nr:RluA family pseudouridine synthase [Solitalea agri]MCO4293926.1 pseudouridine synthase [Solitalea agri]
MREEYIIMKDNCFIPFAKEIEAIALPQKFTFPFYYEPHSLSLLAAEELQQYLATQTEWEHNFGIEEGQEGLIIGKMFGVLVVQNKEGQLGYLSAFSGKLAGQNHHSRFVPPVFDMLTENGFFRKEEQVLTSMHGQIEALENHSELAKLKEQLASQTTQYAVELEAYKQQIKLAKQERDLLRNAPKDTEDEEHINALHEELRKQSLNESLRLKHLNKYWKHQIAETQNLLDEKLNEIAEVKEERKNKSAALQQKLFDSYYFLNQLGHKKSLHQIFKHTTDVNPPAGAGECAAPKLLQYAFMHQLKPIAMAEFWWGQSPKSEVRVHGHFYPACKGKCEPILAHMLEGIEMDENPMLINPAEGKDIDIVFEDEELVVINKPAEFLSVPGKNVQDSVYERVRIKYPEATGPLVVHRLDMSTSGLMLIAKTKESHKILQDQFINRTVKKRYVALLNGVIPEDEGIIELPLRVDLEDRPRQLVCYEYGKHAKTIWKVISRTNQHTKVHFYPITGRTHQLRVHAAHSLGLKSPIVGDDLYGQKAARLHLHAEFIEFKHPVSKEVMKIRVDADF